MAMLLDAFPTTAAIKALFGEEIAAAGGVVSDTFDDGRRLFARSVLPRLREVATGDKVKGGVALMATEGEVTVHPYVYRLVCKNGAIAATTIQTREIEARAFVTPEEVLGAVREAIRECCADDVFATVAKQMRSAQQVQADFALALLPYLARLSPGEAARIADSILDRFSRARDGSRFGLMNAVTSVARDSKQPEVRWRLEEMGGAICAGITPTPRPIDGMKRIAARERSKRRNVMGVG
jgi:hypothetical protein